MKTTIHQLKMRYFLDVNSIVPNPNQPRKYLMKKIKRIKWNQLKRWLLQPSLLLNLKR